MPLELGTMTDYHASNLSLNVKGIIMKKTFLIGLLVVVAAAFSTCKFGSRGLAGSGVRKTEKRELKPFKAIDAKGAYEINVTCQKPASFEIEADDNILPLIKTEVHDGVLIVSNDESYHSSKAVTLRIAVPELDEVTSRGAGEINISDAAGEKLRLESLGAASFNATGKVKSVEISSTGAGSINAANLQAEEAKVDVTGAASVEVYASDQLDAKVSGAASVEYSGNPKTVNKSVAGIGSVNPKQ
jgi:Putative auto-transporter adhesin, head GIN domain